MGLSFLLFFADTLDLYFLDVDWWFLVGYQCRGLALVMNNYYY